MPHQVSLGGIDCVGERYPKMTVRWLSIFMVVGKPGLEPGRLAAHNPKSRSPRMSKYLNVFLVAKKVLNTMILCAVVPLSSFSVSSSTHLLSLP